MKTTHTMLVIAALCFTAAALASAANPHIGTWKLNESKSKFAPGGPKNHTVTYTEAEGGIINVTVDGTGADGKAVHWTVQCKFDGKPYKVEGNPSVDTITYKKVNDHTNNFTGIKDGKTVVTGTITVSNDGKSRLVTTTSTGPDGKKVTDKAYYDKE
jgi:hypothetical protein